MNLKNDLLGQMERAHACISTSMYVSKESISPVCSDKNAFCLSKKRFRLNITWQFLVLTFHSGLLCHLVAFEMHYVHIHFSSSVTIEWYISHKVSIFFKASGNRMITCLRTGSPESIAYDFWFSYEKDESHWSVGADTGSEKVNDLASLE